MVAPYRDLILKEFKVTSFEGLIKRIVDKLKQVHNTIQKESTLTLQTK